MTKRTITDQEIALIKAMLARGMKNKNIQFFFNRPDRSVNSGRITDILNGKYSNSKGIAPASATELDAFIECHQHSDTGVKIEAELPFAGPKPFSHHEYLKELFHKNDHGAWCLRHGETDEIECKHEFDPKKLTQIIRAIAALSNNKGGYVLIGVKDDLTCDGISAAFEATDVSHIMEKIKYHLSPTPNITTKSKISLEDKEVGFIHVDPHNDKPVIVYRDGDKLAEGDILFRYAGQSSRIKFGDLRSMLDERDKISRMAFLSAAGRLVDISPSSALVIDTDKNVLDADGKKIVIDEKLAQSLKFIKEGEFDQKSGAPTLKLMGEVSVSSSGGIIHEKISTEAIFQEHILLRFLEQSDVDDPFQFIVAGMSQPRNWQPIFYFARKAGISNADILAGLKKIKNLPKGKLRFLSDRINGKKRAFSNQISKPAKSVLNEILKGNIAVPTKSDDAICYSQAIIALPDGAYDFKKLLSNLLICNELIEVGAKGDPFGWLFKAACRLDEMLYFDALKAPIKI